MLGHEFNSLGMRLQDRTVDCNRNLAAAALEPAPRLRQSRFTERRQGYRNREWPVGRATKLARDFRNRESIGQDVTIAREKISGFVLKPEFSPYSIFITFP